MKIDSRDVPEGTRLDTDVCVVGAGPAGISLAIELEATGIEVDCR
jgi:flavin-dependent dehydrogenase